MFQINNREQRIFSIAKEVSYLSNFKGPRLGAVVVLGKTIISTGYNSNKSRPLQKKLNRIKNFSNYDSASHSEHAEVSALSHLIGKEIDWSHVSIFVYRELKDGSVACSRPCISCYSLIKQLGIKTLYYVNENLAYIKEKIL